MRNSVVKNLKIRTRLLAVFLAVILLSLSLTILAINQTNSVRKNYESVLRG